MIKKVFSIIPAFCVILLSSCIFDNDEHIGRNNFINLIDLIENNENEKIEALFSPSYVAEIDNLDEQIELLCNYYNGPYESVPVRSFGSTGPIENGKVIKIFDMAYTIITNDYVYFFTVRWCVRDDWDSSNVGIWYIAVERCEDFDAFPTSVPYYEQYKGIIFIE